MILTKIIYTYKGQQMTYVRQFKNKLHLDNYVKLRKNKTQDLTVKILKKI